MLPVCKRLLLKLGPERMDHPLKTGKIKSCNSRFSAMYSTCTASFFPMDLADTLVEKVWACTVKPVITPINKKQVYSCFIFFNKNNLSPIRKSKVRVNRTLKQLFSLANNYSFNAWQPLHKTNEEWVTNSSVFYCYHFKFNWCNGVSVPNFRHAV